MGTTWACVYQFLLAWQTLIAGLIALGGAILTVLALNRQAREAAERRARAARARLPAALDLLNNYALQCVRWLKDLKPKAEIASTGAYQRNQSIPVGTCPRPDGGMMDTFAECVAALDIAPARFIDDLLARLQVQHSRIASLADYFENHYRHPVRQILNIEDYVANAIEIDALGRSAYPYARKQCDETPRGLDLGTVTQAFQACELDASSDAATWKILSDRYIEQAAAKTR